MGGSFPGENRIHKDLRKKSSVPMQSIATAMSGRFEGSFSTVAQRCQATCSCSKSLDLWWKIQSLPGQDLRMEVIMMKHLPRLVN